MPQQHQTIALAAHNYNDVARVFPAGQMVLNFSTKPKFRGYSLFVYLLALRRSQNVIYQKWDFSGNPCCNTVGCACTSLTGNVIPTYNCPSDIIPQNPYQEGTAAPYKYYGITSYGGNGGTRSYPPCQETADGMFFRTGPAAPTESPGQDSRWCTDGTSTTLFFGERNHVDTNYDTFYAPGWSIDPMGGWGWWASTGGNYGGGDLTQSSFSPINYMCPITYSQAVAEGMTNATLHQHARLAARLLVGEPASRAGAVRDGRRLRPDRQRVRFAIGPRRSQHAGRPRSSSPTRNSKAHIVSIGFRQRPKHGLPLHFAPPVFVAALLAASLLAGCGRSVTLGEVNGTVRVDGQPLGQVFVVFIPEDPQQPQSTGVTDAEGRFKLRCNNRRSGAVVGQHRVTIVDAAVAPGGRKPRR